MTELRNLLVFLLTIVGGFVYICNAVPQIKSEVVEEQGEIGTSPEELIAAGKRIFNSDRAQCLTCHSLGEDAKARCPNLASLGEKASTRKPGMGAAEYLVESTYNPNAFIAPGYPKNQMTPVNKPPIALSHNEILAVIAFLNSDGGVTDDDFVQAVQEMQKPWIDGTLQPEQGGSEEARIPILAGDVKRGRQVFAKKICIKCHRVGTEGEKIGPELTAIGGSQTGDYILESILEPNAVIVKGYKELVVQLDRKTIRGTAVAWFPNKEHPEKLALSVMEGGEPKEIDIDLAKAGYVGDTWVEVFDEEEDDVVVVYGEHVEGDQKSGVTLKILKDGSWVQQSYPAEDIESFNSSLSGMPTGVEETMTPQEIFDLIAYLLAQKGGE